METITVQEWIKRAERVHLTPPQRRLLNKIKDGYRLRVKHPHRMNGGEIVFVTPDGREDYAGRIYRVTQYLMWKVNAHWVSDLYV